MTPATGKKFVHDTRFEIGRSNALLWTILKDQRTHDRATVLKQIQTDLQIKDPEDRLKWFVFHGKFPSAGQAYRYIVHDDKKKKNGHLCLDARKIEEIPN